jgi:predicted nucleic acid-binding protein
MVAWLLEESAHALAADLDELFSSEALSVPAHWPAEIGNALVQNLRRRRISAPLIEELIQECSALDIRVEPGTPVTELVVLSRLAIAQNLTLYDAVYVKLAIDRSIALGTLDGAMRAAAMRLGISLYPATLP